MQLEDIFAARWDAQQKDGGGRTETGKLKIIYIYIIYVIYIYILYYMCFTTPIKTSSCEFP